MTFNSNNSIAFTVVSDDFQQYHKGLYLPNVLIYDGPPRAKIQHLEESMFDNRFRFKIDFDDGELLRNIKVIKSTEFIHSPIMSEYDPGLMPKDKKTLNTLIPMPYVLVLSLEQYDAYAFYCPYLRCGYLHSIVPKES